MSNSSLLSALRKGENDSEDVISLSSDSRAIKYPDYVDQPKQTYSGCPINKVPFTLPYATQSLCPECIKPIKAIKYEENGKVWMKKTCPQHGEFKELISPDVSIYMSMFTMRFGDERGVSNPLVTNGKVCPESCGICNMHHSHTALANIDLTNRCDMTCPVCFANSNVQGFVSEPGIEEVRKMLQKLRDIRPVPCGVIQFSGGEPTIHPQFIDIVRLARDMGFWHIQAATNGKKMTDLDFARRAREAGLYTLYLQFDGVTDDIYMKTRGERLFKMKMKVIENARKAGLRIVLVPTIIRGINDHQVGDIVWFAIENVDLVTGISFQPVSFTGRINEKKRLEQRYTITHLAKDVEEQTGLIKARGGWLPLSCTSPFARLSEALSAKKSITITCHPDCGSGAFIFINPDNHKEAVALTDFFNLRSALIDVQKLALQLREKPRVIHLFTKFKTLNILKKHFNPKNTPSGLTFKSMLDILDDYKYHEAEWKENTEIEPSYPTMFIAAMHFQDLYNYDIARVCRCVIHYSARDGKIYPFCTYNSGPYYRNKVESSYAVPLDIYMENYQPKNWTPRKALLAKAKEFKKNWKKIPHWHMN